MAAAGIERLGLQEYITEYFDTEQMLPAPGQGAISVEVKKNNNEIIDLIMSGTPASTRSGGMRTQKVSTASPGWGPATTRCARTLPPRHRSGAPPPQIPAWASLIQPPLYHDFMINKQYS